MENKIRALYENEAFTTALKAAETFEDAAELFKANGIDVPAEMLEEIAKDAIKQNENDLTEADLDDVNGGFLHYVAIAGGCLLGGYVVGRLIVWATSR